jgi:hypothetical protein
VKLSFRVLFVALVVTVLTIAADARAADDLPPALIAQLLMKVATYDRNHAQRHQARPRVLVYENASDERSVRTATMLAEALREPEINRGPVDVVPFTSAADLASAIDARGASIVVLTGGLEDSAGAIAAALSGKDVLSFGTTGALAERGVVVGFELREGKPKIVVNPTRARAQNVSLTAQLLALARIIP